MRTTPPRTAYRAAVALALFSSVVLIWLGLGVGIIGADGDRTNLLYGAVLLVGAAGAFIARLQPAGMARTLVAMAAAQATIAVIAVLAGWGLPWSPPVEILALNAGFVAMFLGSAWLFQRGARERPEPAPSDPAQAAPWEASPGMSHRMPLARHRSKGDETCSTG